MSHIICPKCQGFKIVDSAACPQCSGEGAVNQKTGRADGWVEPAPFSEPIPFTFYRDEATPAEATPDPIVVNWPDIPPAPTADVPLTEPTAPDALPASVPSDPGGEATLTA